MTHAEAQDGGLPTKHLTLWESGSRGPVAARIAIAGDFLPSERLTFPEGDSWISMASPLASHFQDVDLLIANLESVLDVREASPALVPRPLNGLGAINSAPAAALDYLRALAPSAPLILSLANNHTYDFGADGIY